MFRVVLKDTTQLFIFIAKNDRSKQYKYFMINDSNYSFNADTNTILYKNAHSNTIEEVYNNIKDKSYYTHIVGVDKDNMSDWGTDADMVNVPTDSIMNIMSK